MIKSILCSFILSLAPTAAFALGSQGSAEKLLTETLKAGAAVQVNSSLIAVVDHVSFATLLDDTIDEGSKYYFHSEYGAGYSLDSVKKNRQQLLTQSFSEHASYVKETLSYQTQAIAQFLQFTLPHQSTDLEDKARNIEGANDFVMWHSPKIRMCLISPDKSVLPALAECANDAKVVAMSLGPGVKNYQFEHLSEIAYSHPDTIYVLSLANGPLSPAEMDIEKRYISAVAKNKNVIFVYGVRHKMDGTPGTQLSNPHDKKLIKFARSKGVSLACHYDYAVDARGYNFSDGRPVGNSFATPRIAALAYYFALSNVGLAGRQIVDAIVSSTSSETGQPSGLNCPF